MAERDPAAEGVLSQEQIVVLRPELHHAPAGHTVPDGHLWCCRCKQDRPLSRFSRNHTTRSGYNRVCKECVARLDTRYRARRNNYALIRNYGLTREDYARLYVEQSCVCAICGQPETKPNKAGELRLLVDHDHKTGVVRGLLCAKCNTALGLFNDDVALLEQALRYLTAEDRALTDLITGS